MLPDLPPYPDTQQLDTKECGVIAKRHQRTIVAWIHSGHLKALRLPGVRGQYRILFGDLKKVLTRQYIPGKDPHGERP